MALVVMEMVLLEIVIVIVGRLMRVHHLRVEAKVVEVMLEIRIAETISEVLITVHIDI